MFDQPNTDAAGGAHTISRISGLGTEALCCWIATPERRDPAKPPLVAIHGMHRGARAQATLLAPHAARAGQTVIAPRFAQETWPNYQQVVRRGRADLALLSLLDDLVMSGVERTERIALCGYSGGAQFAHRFAMLYPHRVATLTLTAAGWYTFPDRRPFPYGLGPPVSRKVQWRPRTIEDLTVFLGLPTRVLVGTKDNTADENTRSGPGIDAQQGRTRHERAIRWVSAMRNAALKCGVQPNIELIELDGCRHDFRTCLAHPAARACLFPSHEALQAL